MYSLLDENTTVEDVEVYEPGENQQLGNNRSDKDNLIEAIGNVDMDDPEALWDFYPKDVRIKGKKILDPFMGGGTSLVEASRFGVESLGVDLNPVAWFVTKKEIEADQTELNELEDAFEQVKNDVADEIKQYYQTSCPNGNHKADVMYNFWVKELDCISCGHTVPLFKDYRVAAGRYENDDSYNVFCPDCEEVVLVNDWQSECTCEKCGNEWEPKNGSVSRGGYYSCDKCGQKESITEVLESGGEYDLKMYAVEYYCEKCDQQGHNRSAYKGYKTVSPEDLRLYEEAKRDWNSRRDLHKYVPDHNIPRGHMTTVEGAGNDVFNHGMNKWVDMFNARQKLCLATLLQSVDNISSNNAREYLLLAFSDSLRTNTMMTSYQFSANKSNHIFKTNSFDPPYRPCEGNVWGSEYGMGTFKKIWAMVKQGVKYARSPTERYISDGETRETEPFSQPIGRDSDIIQDNMRNIHAENEYDAVITDPPYYANIIYSDLSDFFYVWQSILLEEEYEGFSRSGTPRKESIVTNPHLGKTAEDFEQEIGEALSVINRVLKQDGILTFTYHHSDEESWGELLASLCENGFEVTATYPASSDLQKFIGGSSVSFDIVIVARPTEDRQPISWDSLRRHIVRTARETRETLQKHREIAGGDIGVIEMGKCFQEYSKHHGKVHRAGDVMSAKEVVDEIYGIIQDNNRGEQDVYRDLLEERKPTYDDLNKHLKRSDASEEQMKDMQLFRIDGNDFILCQWDDEKRQAYVQSKVEENNNDLTNLDKAHFLRYRFEQGKDLKEYLEHWSDDELQEICEGLTEATGDETYLTMVGVDRSIADFTDE
jgi:adenine-specific DNA methylase